MNSLIETYGLAPHPEGGFYKEIYRSDLQLNSPAVKAERAAATHILYLLLKGQVSRFHCVKHDEIWHYYQGAPLRLITMDSNLVEDHQIGGKGFSLVSVVPGGCYQAAESTGDFTLVGCTVAPGFDFDDFDFLSNDLFAARQLLKMRPDLERFV